ncbi:MULTISPECIES: hypothetical protein [unclassified Bradyrhizobium]|uniref:hypothetical protein n=1 Tax=unclassified Bradyrhizobium TaxID=2631580 RepID=UPI001FFB6EA2|nr:MULTISPECIES: hypothetical protein [unclassified Bradyrhizobium]MCK1676658.1 hypothetical protein [Bradyrhizobium sp. 150]UPJ30318.1 hypothetical protein IVB54_15530 [Bradyrhizobium sp. CW1]
MMYLKGALALLQASGLVTKLIVAGSLALAVLGAYGVWHHKVYRAGYDRALADIAAEDARAIASATELRSTWLACRKAGRRWMQSEGKCA